MESDQREVIQALRTELEKKNNRLAVLEVELDNARTQLTDSLHSGNVGSLVVRAILGMGTKRGIVSVHWRDTMIQMTPEEARDVARDIESASWAAQADEWCYRVAREKLGLDEVGALNLVSRFRDLQQEKKNGGGPYDPPTPNQP